MNTKEHPSVSRRSRFANLLRGAFAGQMPRLGSFAFKRFFDIMPKHVETELFPGILADMDFEDSIMQSTYWQGKRFERPTGQRLESWCKRADYFFDIGSNYGFFSWWMASAAKDLKIHAFEPNPEVYQRLDSIRIRNGLSVLRAWNIGLSDFDEILPLRIGISDSGHSTFGEHPELGSGHEYSVQLLAFDTWCKQHNIAPERGSAVVKIDVEGFEMRVLNGMRDALNNQIFIGICIELNPYTLAMCGTSDCEVIAFLRSHGYYLQELAAGNGLFVCSTRQPNHSNVRM